MRQVASEFSVEFLLLAVVLATKFGRLLSTMNRQSGILNDSLPDFLDNLSKPHIEIATEKINMENERCIVVTTIQAPTHAIELISSLCERGWSAVVIGDTKTPNDWMSPNTTYLSVDDQVEMFGEVASMIPVRHYSRKNLELVP